MNRKKSKPQSSEYQDAKLALARRADKKDGTLTMAQARKLLRIGHRKDVYR